MVEQHIAYIDEFSTYPWYKAIYKENNAIRTAIFESCAELNLGSYIMELLAEYAYASQVDTDCWPYRSTKLYFNNNKLCTSCDSDGSFHSIISNPINDYRKVFLLFRVCKYTSDNASVGIVTMKQNSNLNDFTENSKDNISMNKNCNSFGIDLKGNIFGTFDNVTTNNVPKPAIRNAIYCMIFDMDNKTLRIYKNDTQLVGKTINKSYNENKKIYFTISITGHTQLKFLQLYQSNVKKTNTKEVKNKGKNKNLCKKKNKMRKKLELIANKLESNDEQFLTVIDNAIKIWEICYTKKLTRGRARRGAIKEHSAAILFYMSCRQMHPPLPYLLSDFAGITGVNALKLLAIFQNVCKEIGITMDVIDPCIYIPRYANLMNLGNDKQCVIETAVKILDQMKGCLLTAGRKIRGVCGAALLMAATIHGYKRTSDDMSRIVGIATCTIEQRMREFMNSDCVKNKSVNEWKNSNGKRDKHSMIDRNGNDISNSMQRKSKIEVNTIVKFEDVIVNYILFVLDDSKWRRAQVIGRENDIIKIHYLGWDNKYNEKISMNTQMNRLSMYKPNEFYTEATITENVKYLLRNIQNTNDIQDLDIEQVKKYLNTCKLKDTGTINVLRERLLNVCDEIKILNAKTQNDILKINMRCIVEIIRNDNVNNKDIILINDMNVSTENIEINLNSNCHENDDLSYLDNDNDVKDMILNKDEIIAKNKLVIMNNANGNKKRKKKKKTHNKTRKRDRHDVGPMLHKKRKM